MTRKYTRRAPKSAVPKGPNPLGPEWMTVRLRGADEDAHFHIPNLIDVLRNPKLYAADSVKDAMWTAANIIEAVSGVAGFVSRISGPTIYGFADIS